MSNDNNNKNKKEEDLNSDLQFLFDGFIKEGKIVDEKEVVPGFKVKLKVLDTGELLIAESIMSESTAPVDIVARVRAASILSQAIIELNGAVIEKEGSSPQDIRIRRALLYKQLLKLPAIVVQKSYAFYIDCVKKQDKKYTDVQKTMDEIENF